MVQLSILLINIYQKYLSFDTGMLSILAPGGACKYPIRCSEYTKQAILEFGFMTGTLLGIKRIWSCK